MSHGAMYHVWAVMVPSSATWWCTLELLVVGKPSQCLQLSLALSSQTLILRVSIASELLSGMRKETGHSVTPFTLRHQQVLVHFIMSQTFLIFWTAVGPVQLLTCAVNNQTSVTLVWSTARYSFNQSMFQVTYMPIPNCNLSLAAMGARKVATVSQNFAVIGSLNPQTCYVFGVRMISGNAVNEDRSIQCTTSQGTAWVQSTV